MVALLAVGLSISGVGCAPAKMAQLKAAPRHSLLSRLKLFPAKTPRASARTEQFVRVNDLADECKKPDAMFQRIQEIIEREPSATHVYAFTELAYLEAEKARDSQRDLALKLYATSALHAYQYLFDPRFLVARNPYDPQFRGACDLYNRSLEGALRLIVADHGLKPGETCTVQTPNGSWDFQCAVKDSRWTDDDVDEFVFVSDYELKGLRNHYQNYGLGVPLIAVRRRHPGEPSAAGYYPDGLSFPVTAFVRPRAGGGNLDKSDPNTRRVAVIELHDPLAVNDIVVGNIRVPLESDLTVPMAYFLANPRLENIGTKGLVSADKFLEFRPNTNRRIMGLYMLQPYEPGKIPVVFVHGLASSPMTWMEMFNDLRSVERIRENYQFWFYLYPTAQPFWITAGQMHKDLATARETIDPRHQQPALDQMVLVGHSMGGLVSRLQTIESGDRFWQLVSDRPFSQVAADPDERAKLESSLFFHPDPSIRCVVTLGTPYRGSKMSNDVTRWLTDKFVRTPEALDLADDRLMDQNKDLIRDDRLLRIETSIDSLDPDSPFFPVMLAGYTAPWVRYHNIIGVLPKKGLKGRLADGGDGVVAYSSAKMDDVASQITVPAGHCEIHSHPKAVLEVRRILLEHLQSASGAQPNAVRPASLP